MSYEYPERFDQVEGGLKRLTDITVSQSQINHFKNNYVQVINTVPTTVLSAFVLKQMATRHRGVVINVASSAAYFDWFYLAVYSATKAREFSL